MRYSQTKEKSGYLRKEGRTLRLRTRRYLSLTGKVLTHHRDEQSPATWSLDATKLSAVAGPRPGELMIVYESRTVSFFTHDLGELEEWLRVLKMARCKLEDWYTLGKEIGRGSYGTVYAGTDRETQEKVAIKIIHKNPSSRRQTTFLEREVKYAYCRCCPLSLSLSLSELLKSVPSSFSLHL
jgi:serine/threonine protein kinase